MLIKGVTSQQLNEALDRTNRVFGGNVEFKEIKKLNASETHPRWQLTLRVKNSHRPGHRRSTRGIRMVSACWHVHGTFFEKLLDVAPSAIIKPGYGHARDAVFRKRTGIQLDVDSGAIINNWREIVMGSLYEPRRLSELCDCATDANPAVRSLLQRLQRQGLPA